MTPVIVCSLQSNRGQTSDNIHLLCLSSWNKELHLTTHKPNSTETKLNHCKYHLVHCYNFFLEHNSKHKTRSVQASRLSETPQLKNIILQSPWRQDMFGHTSTGQPMSNGSWNLTGGFMCFPGANQRKYINNTR